MCICHVLLQQLLSTAGELQFALGQVTSVSSQDGHRRNGMFYGTTSLREGGEVYQIKIWVIACFLLLLLVYTYAYVNIYDSENST